MKKLLLILTVLLSVSFSSFATYKVETCIKSHEPGSPCFELHITISENVPGIGDVYISSGDVWVGGTSAKPCPPGMIANPNPNCGIYTYDNENFITDVGARCLEGILSDPTTYAIYEASRDAALNFANTGYMRTSKTSQNPTANNMINNKQILTIYPNPSTVKNLIINTKVDKKQSELTMNVYDINGRKVYNLDFTGKEIAVVDANVSQLANGTYQFVLTNKRDILASQKVILQ